MSKIQWTDATWNPVRGCSRVSEGCRNCYAERMAARNLPEMRSPTTGQPFAVRGSDGAHWTGKVELIPSKLDEPLRWRKPRRVFVNSMSDLFHETWLGWQREGVFLGPGFGELVDVVGVMRKAERHTFQILTKRARVMADLWPRVLLKLNASALPNVWLGVSVEDQKTADERIPLLLETPAAKRFVSYEPALGPVDFNRREYLCRDWNLGKLTIGRYLDWIIVGGESGPGARPFDVAWARETVRQCRETHTAAFVKQMGHWILGDAEGFGIHSWLLRDEKGHECGFVPPIIGPAVFERPKNAVAFTLGGKGGDPAYWPEDLRVREFPS